ncbi:28 kDa ribonucleoprotein [Apiospora arundinis]
MALARSASGPGGLSINTGSANNLFGQSSTPAPAAGSSLFGNTQANQTSTTTGSSLFGNAASSTPKTGGGLFGTTPAANNAQPQQQTSGGLFGATSNNAAQPAQQQQPQTGGGGLFGGLGASQQQQQPAASGGGGLFGALGGNTQQQQQQPQQQQPQQQASGGLFGGSAFSKPAASSSFMNQSSSQARPGFGATSTGMQQPSMPGLTMGQSQSQTTVPGVRINVGDVRGTTRFNDLHEDLQKQITEVDRMIQNFMTQKDELDAFMPGHGEMLQHIPEDVKFVERKYGGVRSALEADAEVIESVRNTIQHDTVSAKLSFRAVDNLKLPQQYHTGGLWSGRQQSSGTANTESDGQDLVNFFSKTADEMQSQLNGYERNLTEIEMHMHGVQDNVMARLQRMMASKNGGATAMDEEMANLGAVLREFEMGILRSAGVIGHAREGMTRLQLGEFMTDGQQNGMY